MKKFQLLMLPFGGGNAMSYTKFQSYLPSWIEIKTYDTAGRGTKIKQAPHKNLYSMADEFFDQFKKDMQAPFAIFGHSMGTYLTHLITERIIEEKLPSPSHIFISSKTAPHLNYNKKRSLLNDAEFVEMLNRLQGMPEHILKDEAMLKLFLPLIRSDFYAIDNYKYLKSTPYNIPMTLFAGTDENVPDEEFLAWKEQCAGEMDFYRFEGGHFWLLNHTEKLCNFIADKLAKY